MRRMIELEPESNQAGPKVPDSYAALSVPSGEAKVGAGWIIESREFAGDGLGAPPDGGDKWGKGEGRGESGDGSGGLGRRGRHRQDGDKLHRSGVDNHDRATSAVSKESGGAAVGGATVVAVRRAGKHGIPCSR